MYIMFEKSLKKTKETSIKLQFPFQEKKKEYWEYHQNKVFDSPFG